jgi:carboxylesterase
MYLQRHLGGMVDMVVLDDSYHIVTVDRQRHVVIDRSVAFAHALIAKLGYKEPVVTPVQMNAAE